MKKAITLFVGMCLITVSAIGQFPHSNNEGTINPLHYKYITGTNRIPGQINNESKLNLPGYHKFPTHNARMFQSSEAIKQRLDSVTNEEYNDNLSQFVLSEKYEYNYDTDQNMVQARTYTRAPFNDQWLFLSKEEITYDADTNITQILEFEWNENTSQFMAYQKSVFLYDTAGNMIHYNEYEWETSLSQWVDSDKAEYTYDANGNLLQFISYYYDPSATQLVNRSKGEFTYNANSLVQFLIYQWDPTSSQWKESDKTDYTTNVNGCITQNLESTWDSITSQWLVTYKGEYTYDANGNPTQESYYFMDKNTNTFIASNKYDYTYDLSYNLYDLILPPASWLVPDYSNKIMNKPLGYVSFSWDEVNNNWNYNSRSTFYYSEQAINSVEQINRSISKIYPNPVKSFISFSFSENVDLVTFELFDIQGRKIMTKLVKNDDQLNMQELNDGIYIYKLINADKIQTGKLVKE